jgi:predicted 3-demethylubiquinone-9 3-methyltransferase (glyoxalase superfamily)
MTPKNRTGIRYDREAEAAARFYASVFPDSEVKSIHRSPMDDPGNKAGEIRVVVSTVCGLSCFDSARRN